MSIASFVLGIVGLVLSINLFTYPVSFICGLLAIIFGIKGLKENKEDRAKAKSGLIIGIITLIISFIISFIIYKGAMYLIDNLPNIMEETLEYFDNEKELFLNDFINQMKQLFPYK